MSDDEKARVARELSLFGIEYPNDHRGVADMRHFADNYRLWLNEIFDAAGVGGDEIDYDAATQRVVALVSRDVPDYDEITSVVSEGFHTALRKVGESAQSNTIRRAINELSDDEWRRVIEFALVGLVNLLNVDVPDTEREGQ